MGTKAHFGIIFLLTITVSLVFVSFSQNSFGATGYFEDHQRELFQQPTICIFQPADIRVDENRWKKWFADSKAAIDEWESILNQHESSIKRQWNIEVVEIPLNKKYEYNSAGCNIEVSFTTLPLEYSVLGWYFLGTGIIEIVTTQSEYCGKQYFPEYGMTFRVYCYKDTLERSKKIAAVLKHELGHAFGLGHYVTTDPTLLESWQNSPLGQPSIMTFAHHNEEQMRIQEIDVRKLHEMYGIGFGQTKNTIPVFKEPEPELEYDFDKHYNPSGSVVEVDYGVITTHKISGTVPESDYMRGKQVEFYIKYPDSSVETTKLHITKNGYYEYPLSFDIQSELGHYQVIVKYGDIEIKMTDFCVEKKSKSSTPKTSLCSTIPTIPTIPTSKTTGPLTLSLFADGKNYGRSFTIEEGKPFQFAGKLTDSKGNPVRSTSVYINDKYDSSFQKRTTTDQSGNFLYYIGAEHNSKNLINDKSQWNFLATSQVGSKTVTSEIAMLTIVSAKTELPDWIKNNAEWWSSGKIDDKDFAGGIEYMIKEKIIRIPQVQTEKEMGTFSVGKIPDWIKNNAKWWSEGKISDDDFSKGIEYMVKEGIIRV